MARLRRRGRRRRRPPADGVPPRPRRRPRPGPPRSRQRRRLDAVRQHDPDRGRAGDARRPGARGRGHRPRALERDRDRAPGERGVDRARWPHRELPVGRDPLRGRLRPLLARPLGGPPRRPRLPPGPLVARLLRARVPRGTAVRGRAAPLPAGGRRRRPLVVPAPVADADVLAVPHRVDGARAADGDLPGALHEVPRRARDRGAGRPQGLGVHGRRRDGRARVDGRDLARGPRAARQPRLRDQLQPAAPRRAGAREREDHPGARDELPRRRLERDQGDLGRELGSPARRGRRGRAPQADGGVRRRRVPDVQGERRRLRARALLRPLPGDEGDGRRLDGRRDLGAPPRRPRPEEGPRRVPRRRAPHGPADGDPREDDQGLRHGAGGRGPQHHAPAEGDERGGAARDPRPARDPAHRRAGDRGVLLPAARVEPGAAAPARAAQGARREPSRAPHRGRVAADAAAVRQRARGQRRPRQLDDDGARPHPQHARPRRRARPARRADRPRRVTHVRDGGDVPPARDLLLGRPALRARGRRRLHVLPRGPARPDPPGGHQRARAPSPPGSPRRRRTRTTARR